MNENEPLIELAGIPETSMIKVIGVGGGGGNAVGQMFRDQIPHVSCLVANTDAKALEDSPVPDRVQIGPGHGAGGNPEEGRRLAEAEAEKIEKMFDAETKMVFITAGMGGGTGTGASPLIARAAKQRGILTVGIVTIPFLFERERQIKKALLGLDNLAREVDALLVINNERLYEIYSDISIIDAFKYADRTLSTAVSAITEIIRMHGHVGVDFADVVNVLRDGGVAVMSTGYGSGVGRVTNAINQAINSPLLNNNDIYHADRILIAITMSEEYALITSEIGELNEFMSHFNEDIETKYGMAIDSKLGERIKVTILAAGFGLYGKKQSRNAELTPQNEEQVRLMEGFYPKNGNRIAKRKQRYHVYTFSDDDLRNQEVLARVEDVPTLYRTSETLSQIKSLSKD